MTSTGRAVLDVGRDPYEVERFHTEKLSEANELRKSKGKIDCVNRGLREMKYAMTFPVGETAYLGHQREILVDLHFSFRHNR
jgi:putative hemolysin